MSEPRSVVITGASRGLGLASATHLYSNGWRVVAAMRAPEVGMTRLRQATGATDDDPRLIGVQLDLTDSASVTAAAKMIAEAVGAPYALVHNAGISAAGMAEETPIGLWEKMFHFYSLNRDEFMGKYHQRSNAEVMVEAGAAVMLEERQLGQSEILVQALSRLLADPQKLRHMSEKARTQAHPGAAARIADTLIQLADR